MTLKLIGHRGNGRTIDSPFTETKAPENTVSSFREAFENGADGVEFDIFVTKDGVPVVTFKNEVAGINLSTLTFKDVKRLSPGTRDTRVPSLEEALNQLARINAQYPTHDFVLNVELKGNGVVEPTIAAIRPFIESGALDWNHITFSAFDWDKLSLAQEIEPRAQLQPTIATVQFFDNVEQPGYYVDPSAPYNAGVLDNLGHYVQTRHCVAIDTPTLDIRPALITKADEWATGFCSHPTGPRRICEAPRLHETIGLLDQFARASSAQVCLKVDDIAAARAVVEDTRQGRPFDLQKLERIGGARFIV